MFYVPRARSHPFAAYVDPEEAYVQAKRREYLEALEQQQRRREYEEALALEEQRHRATMAALAHQEAIRRRRAAAAASPAPAPFVSRSPACGHGSCAPEYRPQTPAHDAVPRKRVRVAPATQPDFGQELLSHLLGLPRSSPTPQQPQPKKNTKGKDRAEQPAEPLSASEEESPYTPADRARSLAAISDVARTFTSLKNTFQFPPGHLDALPGADVPRLAYTPTNATVHAYEHALSELLTKLDAVESYGFKGVRDARKELVVQIEKELEDLEKKVSERLAASVSPVVPSVPIPIDVEEPSVVPAAEAVSAAPVVEAAHEEVVGYDAEPEPVVVVEAAQDSVMQEQAPEAEPAAPILVDVSEEPSPSESSLPEPVTVETPAAVDLAPPTVPSTATTQVPDAPFNDVTVEKEDDVIATEPVPAPSPAPVQAPVTSDPAHSDPDSEIEDAVEVTMSTDDEGDLEKKKADAEFELL